MRSILVAAILPLAANALECGSSGSSSASVEAPTIAASTSNIARASRGGKLVAVGDASLELVVKADGIVEAYPVESDVTVTKEATIDARVTTTAGLSAPLRLGWNEAGYFEGRIVDAIPRPGDVELTVEGGGLAKATGRASAAPIVVVAARGGNLVDAGSAKAELLIAESGNVQLIPAFPSAESEATFAADTEVRVDVAVEGGASDEVRLAWNPALFVYEGHVGLGKTVTRGASVVHIGTIEARSPAVTVVPASALVVAGPQFGGTVIDVEGGAKLEVAASADGRVFARPLATCVTTPRVESGATVNIELTTGSGTSTVPLVWNEAHGGFSGQVAAGARLEGGPAHMTVARPQHAVAHGRVDVVTVMPAAQYDARITLVTPGVGARVDAIGAAHAASGEATSEAARLRAAAEAQAARVRAGVQPPSVRVSGGASAGASAGGGASSSTSTMRSTSEGSASAGASFGVMIGR